MRFSMIWRYRFVRCMLMCTSPVAVRVAVRTQRTRSVWGQRVTYEFAVGLLRLSRAEVYSQGDLRDPAHPAPVVPDLFRPVQPGERCLRSTSIPPQQPGRMPLLRWQRRGVWAALSTALEARLGGRQSGDNSGKGGGDEVESGRDRDARGRQEGGEDQGCRPAEDGDRDAVAQ